MEARPGIVPPAFVPSVVVMVASIFDIAGAADKDGAGSDHDGWTAEVDAHTDLDGGTRRWHVKRNDWTAHHGRCTPTRTAKGNFGSYHRWRNLNVDYRSRVRHGRVGFVDDRIPWTFVVVGLREFADVPIGAAAQLELRLRRRLIPVVVRTLDVAVDRMTELHLGVDHGMCTVVREAGTIVVERRGVADEVVLPVALAVHAWVAGCVVVDVRHVDVAEAAAILMRHRMLRNVFHHARLRCGGKAQGKQQCCND